MKKHKPKNNFSPNKFEKMFLVFEKIMELESKMGKYVIISELKKEVVKIKRKGVAKIKEREIDEIISKLVATGIIFIPRAGFVERLSNFRWKDVKYNVEAANRENEKVQAIEEAKTQEKLKQSKEFLSYLTNSEKEKAKTEKVLICDYNRLEKSSKQLAHLFLEEPEETLALLESALDQIINDSRVRIRFIGLPKSCNLKIRDIRCKHINKLITIKGGIIQVSDIRPQVVCAKFECPSCGTIISVLQIEKKFREPSRCSCGRKGQFRLISKEMVDAQRIIIGQGKQIYDEEYKCKIATDRLQVFLQEDLCDSKYRIFDNLGKEVLITGILREIPISTPRGGISTRFDLAIEANNLEIKK